MISIVNPTSCSSSPPSLLGTSAMAAAASLSVSRPRNPFRLPPAPPPPTMPSGAAGELFSIRTCFKFLFAAIFRARSFLEGRGARFGNHRLQPSANSKWRRRQPRRVVTSLREAPPTPARAAFPTTTPAHCWARGWVRACAVGGGRGVRRWRPDSLRRRRSLSAPAHGITCLKPREIGVFAVAKADTY